MNRRFYQVLPGEHFVWRADEWIRVRASVTTRLRRNYAVNLVTGECRWFPGMEVVSNV